MMQWISKNKERTCSRVLTICVTLRPRPTSLTRKSTRDSCGRMCSSSSRLTISSRSSTTTSAILSWSRVPRKSKSKLHGPKPPRKRGSTACRWTKSNSSKWNLTKLNRSTCNWKRGSLKDWLHWSSMMALKTMFRSSQAMTWWTVLRWAMTCNRCKPTKMVFKQITPMTNNENLTQLKQIIKYIYILHTD